MVFLLSDVNECTDGQTNPCQNGGTCVNKNGGFDCDCTIFWKGDKCNQGMLSYDLPVPFAKIKRARKSQMSPVSHSLIPAIFLNIDKETAVVFLKNACIHNNQFRSILQTVHNYIVCQTSTFNEVPQQNCCIFFN